MTKLCNMIATILKLWLDGGVEGKMAKQTKSIMPFGAALEYTALFVYVDLQRNFIVNCLLLISVKIKSLP